MDLAQLANIGEFVGGVAVLVTLIYLSVQVRQSNDMAKIAAADKHSDTLIDICKESLQHTDVYLAGAARYSELAPREKLRFRWIIGIVFTYLQNFYTKYRAGVIGEEEWNQHYQVLLWYLAGPGMKDWWDESHAVYGKAFGELVTGTLNDIRDGKIEIPAGTAELYVEESAQH